MGKGRDEGWLKERNNREQGSSHCEEDSKERKQGDGQERKEKVSGAWKVPKIGFSRRTIRYPVLFHVPTM